MARNIYSQTSPFEGLTALGQGLQQGVGQVMQQMAEQKRQAGEIGMLGQAMSKLGGLKTREDVLFKGMDIMRKVGMSGMVSQDWMNNFLNIIYRSAAVTPSKADIATETHKEAMRPLEKETVELKVDILEKELEEFEDKDIKFLYRQAIDEPGRWSPEIVRKAAEEAGLEPELVETIAGQANKDIKISPAEELLFGTLKYQKNYTETEVDNAITQLKEKGLIPKDMEVPKIDRTAKAGTMEDVINKTKQAALVKVLSDYVSLGMPITYVKYSI